MSEFNHYSVLQEETIKGLNIKEDGIYVDCTLGGAGHSGEILKRLTGGGHLYAFDQDMMAIDAAKERLSAIGDNFTIIHSNFVNLKEELANRGINKVDGFVFDLGVSSPQFDNPERGFSYNYDAYLDMRMNREQDLTAFDVVNTWDAKELSYIIYKYSDEKFARRIASFIVKRREEQPIKTTFELVDIIKAAIPAAARRTGGHPAKRTFQAIRIAVNDELRVFETALEDAIDITDINGRIAVITFHSLEDRICKTTFKEQSEMQNIPRGLPVIPDEFKPKLKMVNKKPIIATNEELEENNRSHSAKLRIAERLSF